MVHAQNERGKKQPVSRSIFSRRFRRRAILIAANIANGLLLPLLNPIVSLLVVRLASIDLWGEYVALLIGVQLAAHIIGWGNKDYLLRQFSFNPTRLGEIWRGSLFTRSLLLIPFGLLTLWLDPARAFGLLVWCAILVFDQSFEVWVTYRKDFVFSTGVELLGLIVTLAGIGLANRSLDVNALIMISISSTALKAVIYLLRYRTSTLASSADRLARPIELAYFRRAFAFFALGLTGLLQSRIDLYVVSLFLTKSAIGQYQVFITFLLYLQSLSAFVLGPFVKNLYRLSTRTILNLSLRMLPLGLVMCGPALILLAVILHSFYGIDLPLTFFALGLVLTLPIYFYVPIIYSLNKRGLTARVVWINLLGIAISGLVGWRLLPALGMLGAVLGAASAQVVMLLVYVWHSRELRRIDALPVPELG
jgi:O-antigen/teichoic acid export membrane protein